ncbi:hypothetical protein BJ878DRAFT_575127 [Calycina marina]|uniref:RRM domain-containing protein n=1 Tax=Calycina marina TaxID=1763456 RepID=A0A9P7Z4H5_9HELO|nr:hypothetical protein BJ878DRAFT_575127 [Calycina marina]
MSTFPGSSASSVPTSSLNISDEVQSPPRKIVRCNRLQGFYAGRNYPDDIIGCHEFLCKESQKEQERKLRLHRLSIHQLNEQLDLSRPQWVPAATDTLRLEWETCCAVSIDSHTFNSFLKPNGYHERPAQAHEVNEILRIRAMLRRGPLPENGSRFWSHGVGIYRPASIHQRPRVLPPQPPRLTENDHSDSVGTMEGDQREDELPLFPSDDTGSGVPQGVAQITDPASLATIRRIKDKHIVEYTKSKDEFAAWKYPTTCHIQRVCACSSSTNAKIADAENCAVRIWNIPLRLRPTEASPKVNEHDVLNLLRGAGPIVCIHYYPQDVTARKNKYSRTCKVVFKTHGDAEAVINKSQDGGIRLAGEYLEVKYDAIKGVRAWTPSGNHPEGIESRVITLSGPLVNITGPPKPYDDNYRLWKRWFDNFCIVDLEEIHLWNNGKITFFFTSIAQAELCARMAKLLPDFGTVDKKTGRPKMEVIFEADRCNQDYEEVKREHPGGSRMLRLEGADISVAMKSSLGE